MKKLFIVANWKENKNALETDLWFQAFNNLHIAINKEEKEVIICPPFTLLPKVKESIVADQLSIGAQDVSPFEKGAYTGEVNAEQVKELADYVIIGHSERRKNFGETDEILTEKVKVAMLGRLQPIFCVQGKETPIPEGVEIVAYEPIFAIGTGHPDTPEDAEDVAKTIKEKHGVKYVLYGGSVNDGDVRTFTQMPSVDGVLVGGASLDAEKFSKIIENA